LIYFLKPFLGNVSSAIAETFNYVLKAILEVKHQEVAPDCNMCVRIWNDLRCLAKWNWKIFDSSSSDFDYSLLFECAAKSWLSSECARFDELREHEQCRRISVSGYIASRLC
jgi:hypothetical protein